MRIAVAAALLVGCTFHHGTYEYMDDQGDHGSGDGMVGIGPDAGTDAGSTTTPPTAMRTCKFPHASLELCIELEDRKFSPKITDASINLLDATPQDFVAEMSRDGGPAAMFSVNARMSVPESPALDVTQLTMELWVRPDWDQQVSLVSNSQQYGLTLQYNGTVTCSFGGQQTTSQHTIPDRQWTHVACTWDGSVMSVYIGGAVSRATSFSSVTAGAGTSGTRIGAGFWGGLDDIRIYSTALAADTICDHTGKSECDLPDNDGGPGGGGGG